MTERQKKIINLVKDEINSFGDYDSVKDLRTLDECDRHNIAVAVAEQID